MNAKPEPRHTFTFGQNALAARREELQARREKVAQERRGYRPRLIGMGVLVHKIPAHVDNLLAGSAWEEEVSEGADRDQRPLYNRTYQVALSLVVRGWTGEDFLAEMPSHDPSFTERRCRETVRVRRENVLWWELCHRRGRPRDPRQMVIKAFKAAEEKLGRGFLLDIDQPAYVEALTKKWLRAVQGGGVRLSPTEVAVLDWVMDQMLAKGRLDVACPAREVGEATGLTHMGAWRTLKRLDSRGILICRNRGVGDKQIGKAAIYCLSPQLEQTFATAHSKPPSSWGGLWPPGRDGTGTTKRPEKAPRIGDLLTVGPTKPLVNQPFPTSVGQRNVTYQKTSLSLPSCTSRGLLIGNIPRSSGQGLSPPGGRAGDTPDHLAGFTVLAGVVDGTHSFLAELESLMGNPAPQSQEEPAYAPAPSLSTCHCRVHGLRRSLRRFCRRAFAARISPSPLRPAPSPRGVSRWPHSTSDPRPASRCDRHR
jgi:hypothetical protein